MKRPAIEEFKNSSAFVKSYYSFLCSRDSGHTVRRWAVQMGLTSPRPIVSVLRQGRGLRLKDLSFILKGMDLSPIEARYLKAVILWETARTPDEKQVIQIAMDSLAGQLRGFSYNELRHSNPHSTYEAEDNDLFSSWLD